jgi:glutamyl-Q tRNA(Asp) synthetase
LKSPLTYRGRFAPSPTGPLHFGSLVAALGSYLDARAHGGTWLVRIEDLDPPREQPGAADDILRTLKALGLHWDEPVLYQHTRLDAYETAIAQLLENGGAFPCACTRSEIADSGLIGAEGVVYPGTCRDGLGGKPARAIRARVTTEPVGFTDRLQGTVSQNLEQEIGDFVIRRADGYFAYQLAVVVDDAFQEITHVVRGADLLISTPRQIHLQHLLGLPTPIYMHLPVAVNAAGEKLSKQTGAQPLSLASPGAALCRALVFLHQSPPAQLRTASPASILEWAVAHWQPGVLHDVRTQKIA